jgi:transcriptional regulator with XRE-family HTH domain
VQLKLDRDKMLRGREVLGYGVEKTAQEAGVSKNSVLRAEHGEDIRPVTARKIAGALGVRVADLLSEESEALKAEALPSLEPSFNDVIEERRLSRFADAIASATDKWGRDFMGQGLMTDENILAGVLEAILDLYSTIAASITRQEWRALTPQEQHELESVMDKLEEVATLAMSRLQASGHLETQQEEMFEQRREEIREWTRKISA